MIAMLGTKQAAVETSGTALLLFLRWWPAQALFTPQATELLMVHDPAFTAHHGVGFAPPQTRMTSSKATEP